MALAPGDRVELVATDDPYTRLLVGARGTVTGIRDFPERTIEVDWDDGSTLSILPAAGDRVRRLPDDQPDLGFASASPTPPGPPGRPPGTPPGSTDPPPNNHRPVR